MVFAAIIVVHAAGFLRFWRESGENLSALLLPGILFKGVRDAMTLRNLDSNGVGCTYPREQHSKTRRRFHHLTFYGFLFCLASTTVAAVYHSFFGWQAPHAYLSVPVLLGTIGGLGLLIGPPGLYVLRLRRDTAIVDVKQNVIDVSFLTLLFLTSLTGMLLLVLRESAAIGSSTSDSSRSSAGLVPHASLREVRARHLSLRRSGALCTRSIPQNERRHRDLTFRVLGGSQKRWSRWTSGNVKLLLPPQQAGNVPHGLDGQAKPGEPEIFARQHMR